MLVEVSGHEENEFLPSRAGHQNQALHVQYNSYFLKYFLFKNL
jgi:hypothetical protein